MTRLLIGYDGSDAARAATTAAAALFPGAEAVVATVHPPPPTLETGALARVALPDDMIHAGIQRMREEALAKAGTTSAAGVDVARSAGLRAEARIVAGTSAWRTLQRLGRDTGADVIVCGARGEGPLERTLLGSTASSLLHHADRPLLIVPAGVTAFDGPVLAGYDDSDGARGALHFAAEHLREHSLVVAYAWRSPIRHTLRGHALLVSGVNALEDYAEAVDTTWQQVSEETAAGGAAYARSLGLAPAVAAPESGHGDWQTLLDAARHAGAAAILVGSRGRGAVASTVLGSVTSGLVHAAALPIVIVPGSSLE